MTTRRGFALGAAVAAAAFGAGVVGWRRMFAYPPTPYDDLLDQIVDRRPAAVLGRAVTPSADAARIAARLRQPGFGLKERAGADAGLLRVVEAQGWVVPETVALYAQLAAGFG